MHNPVINPAITPSAYPLRSRRSECQVLSKQQHAIGDETVQDFGRTGKIRQRQQPHTGGDDFPQTEQQRRSGKDWMQVLAELP